MAQNISPKSSAKAQDEELRSDIKRKCKNDFGIDLIEDEVTMCIIEMERAKVSIFHNQIWPQVRLIGGKDDKVKIKRLTWTKTIDGLRAVAHRNGFCGCDSPVFEIDSKGLPISATITVRRFDRTIDRIGEFTAKVMYSEFVEKYFNKDNKAYEPNFQWAKRPFNQLAKCAETHALRRAFQDQYEPDDTDHVDGYVIDETVSDTAEEHDDLHREEIHEVINNAMCSSIDEARGVLKVIFSNPEMLTKYGTNPRDAYEKAVGIPVAGKYMDLSEFNKLITVIKNDENM